MDTEDLLFFSSNDLHLVFTMKKKNNPDVNMGTFFVPCMSQTTVKPRMPSIQTKMLEEAQKKRVCLSMNHHLLNFNTPKVNQFTWGEDGWTLVTPAADQRVQKRK